MNATIEKIVGLLFEDLQETEETRAIREEVLRNCTERYQDLLEAGMSEDDAIAAVIESLNGMEEMLADYPRKEDGPAGAPNSPEAESIPDAAQEGAPAWSCDPAGSSIREIRMEHLARAEAIVCLSQDHLLHVECSNPELMLITGLENGVLTIALKEKQENEPEEWRFSLEKGFDLSSIGRMFGKIARRFTDYVGSAEVTLAIPASLCPELRIGTASGNVTVEPMKLARLYIGTASGDVEVISAAINDKLRVISASGDIRVSGAKAHDMQLSSTSGDIEADDCIINGSVKLNSTSGDIDWSKQCRTLNAHSVSGDITLDGEAQSISFRTVSGDAELDLCGSQLYSITGSTASGDVTLSLPAGIQAAVTPSTVSGEICNHIGSVPDAPVAVRLNTVSGDIRIN